MSQKGGTLRQRERAKHRREAARIDLLERRVIRPGRRVGAELDFRYDPVVAGGTVDRGEWAKAVQELLDIEADQHGKIGAKTRFGAKVGVSVRTVDAWLRRESDVRDANVKGAAAAYNRDEIQMLARVGLLSLPAPEEHDDEVEMILAAPVSSAEKQRHIDRLIAMRERDKLHRMEDLRFSLERAAEQVDDSQL